jgi:hypothetical protein
LRRITGHGGEGREVEVSARCGGREREFFYSGAGARRRVEVVFVEFSSSSSFLPRRRGEEGELEETSS